MRETRCEGTGATQPVTKDCTVYLSPEALKRWPPARIIGSASQRPIPGKYGASGAACIASIDPTTIQYKVSFGSVDTSRSDLEPTMQTGETVL